MPSSAQFPPPPVPIDVDVRDLDGFMLNVERLLASELVALGTPEECWAALMLWCRAWKQVPAGSLANDERILASFSGAGKRWPKVRQMALRGFVLCSDGRLYHKVLCEDVRRAAERKAGYLAEREQDRERLKNWREAKRLKRLGNANETRFETPNETPNETLKSSHRNACETSNTGQGLLRGESLEESLEESLDSSAARGAALPGANGSVVKTVVNGAAAALSVNSRKALTKEQKHQIWAHSIWLHLTRTRTADEVAKITDSFANGDPWGKAKFEEIDREIKALRMKC